MCVSIIQPEYPCFFNSGIDLGVYQPETLLRAAIRCANGRTIQWWRSPRWNSAVRGCRAVLHLDAPEDRKD